VIKKILFILQLKEYLKQQLSTGCTVYNEEYMVFVLLNSLFLEYPPFTTSIADTEPLIIIETSLRFILEH